MVLQSLLRAIYPPQCLTCDTLTDTEHALCPECWRAANFIHGLVCDSCGLPLPGAADDIPVQCDDCLRIARPWEQGRAAMLYGDKSRAVVLGLKYYDRHDYARAAGHWLHAAARPMLRPGMLVAPIPLHWLRLAKRRYNQSALLSAGLAQAAGLEHCPDLLVRTRHTGTQDGRGLRGRFDNVVGAIAPHPRRGTRIQDRDILLVDDVMTAGATFSAATEACITAGAASVRVVALARVAPGA